MRGLGFAPGIVVGYVEANGFVGSNCRLQEFLNAHAPCYDALDWQNSWVLFGQIRDIFGPFIASAVKEALQALRTPRTAVNAAGQIKFPAATHWAQPPVTVVSRGYR